MFGIREHREPAPDAQYAVKSTSESDAPFQIEFAPGVIVLSAEVRDRASLRVFVNAALALAELLPEAPPKPPEELPPPRQVVTFDPPVGAAQPVPFTPPAEQDPPVPTTSPPAAA